MWPWCSSPVRMRRTETVNEGLCLKCAGAARAAAGGGHDEAHGHQPGRSREDLNNEMMQAFGGAEEMSDLPDGRRRATTRRAARPRRSRSSTACSAAASPAEKPEEGGAAGGKYRATRASARPIRSKSISTTTASTSPSAPATASSTPSSAATEEIERVVQILNRRQKNNPCLIGEPGVGKTAIAEGLAQRIVHGRGALTSCATRRSISST